MSDYDVECYAHRYSDLEGMEPREHFISIGKKQGRLGTCGRNLTDYEA